MQFKDTQETMQLWMVKSVGWLRWLFSFASGQVEVNETVTDSVNLSVDLGITCVGNLAVFAVILI